MQLTVARIGRAHGLRGEVALDGPDAHLEPLGEAPGADRTRGDGAQDLDERVQAVGAVHQATVGAGSDARATRPAVASPRRPPAAASSAPVVEPVRHLSPPARASRP